MSERVDLGAIVALAATAADRQVDPVALLDGGPPVRIAVAGGRAFTFTYTDTLDTLRSGGAEIVPFDPLRDPDLPPAIDGLLVGGGFPETHAEELAANEPLLADVARRVRSGLTTWAECGGLLWLSQELDGHAMAGVLPVSGRMTSHLTLGYRRATTEVVTPLGPVGTELRGHEFHYSTTTPAGGRARSWSSRWGARHEGFASDQLLATYLHHHPGGDPAALAGFLDACRRPVPS